MGNYNFQKDLSNSHKSVEEWKKIFEKNGIEIDSYYHGKEYDLKTKKGNRIEIKEDFRCFETGNVAVEFECRGKPSGISVTKSEVIGYKIHETQNKSKYYIIRTSDLKNAILERKYFRIVTDAGDVGSNTKIYLFKLKEIQKIAKEVKYER